VNQRFRGNTVLERNRGKNSASFCMLLNSRTGLADIKKNSSAKRPSG
jgi:hypothetical protein